MTCLDIYEWWSRYAYIQSMQAWKKITATGHKSETLGCAFEFQKRISIWVCNVYFVETWVIKKTVRFTNPPHHHSVPTSVCGDRVKIHSSDTCTMYHLWDLQSGILLVGKPDSFWKMWWPRCISEMWADGPCGSDVESFFSIALVVL